jgi:hypothetical protein
MSLNRRNPRRLAYYTPLSLAEASGYIRRDVLRHYAMASLLIVDGNFVQTDHERDRMLVELEAEAKRRHIAKPAKTEAQRTLLTAKMAFARYGESANYESRDGQVFVNLGLQQRGTTRAARPTRRPVRRTSSATNSRGDPDREPPPSGGPRVTVSRSCQGCGASLDGRRSQTRTCSDACRKRISRSSSSRLEEQPLLTAEQRLWLKGEIDRRRRAQVAAFEREERQIQRERRFGERFRRINQLPPEVAA